MRLGTLLFILLIILVLAVLLGAGGYSVRRYWSPAGSEVVEMTDTGSGAGAGIAAAILSLFVLILLFFGFTQCNLFGTGSAAQAIPSNPTLTSPLPGTGGGGKVSPISSPRANAPPL